MSKLARLSLANRSLVALLSIGIIAFGLIATGSLKQELIPSLQLPGAFITTTYPGASPEIVEREVTEPIESAIGGVDGMKTYTSTSSSGMSVVQAEFTYGTDVDRAVQNIQQSLNRISTQLPKDVDPVVGAGSTDDIPVVLLAVSSDQSQKALVDKLNASVVPELESVSGVRQAQVTGAREPRVSIRLDAKRLASKGLTAASVSSALQANGISTPGGQLTTDGTSLPVDVGRQFDSLQAVKDLPIMPSAAAAAGTAGAGAGGVGGAGNPTGQGDSGSTGAGGQGAGGQTGRGGQSGGQTGQGGQGGNTSTTPPTPAPVRLGDVATVSETLAPATSITRTDGKASLGISVTKLSDANTVSVSEDVRAKIGDLEKTLGDNAKLTVVFDQAPFIQQSIKGLTTEGGIGLAFAILVILIFLLSLRSTIVTAVSIPMSLLVAMIGLYTGGYSLNILTLGALTVAVGRVVDDSIVVLENIKRHLSYGEEKAAAILAGVREVAGAVTASTITTVGVFLPIAFVGGQVGELFRPFAVTVTIALLASLLVALTIIPVLAYWFLKRPKVDPERARELHEQAIARERRNPLQRAYVPVIRWTTRHKAITIVAGILVFVGTMAMTPMLKTNFLDSSGQNTLSISQKLPVGSSLHRTDEAAREVEAVLKDTKDVTSYQVTIGNANFGGFSFGGGQNDATFSVTTDDKLDADQQKSLSDNLRRRLDKLDGAGEITVGGSQGGFGGNDLKVIVKASNVDTLRTAAGQVASAMRGIDGVTDVSNNMSADQPSVSVSVDRTKAARAGLSDAQIGQTVRQAFQGATSGSVIVDGSKQDLVLDGGAAPESLAALRNLSIPTPLGSTVKLSSVASVTRTAEPASLTRIDGDRSATVTGTPSGTDLGSINADLTKRLDALKLPGGASYEIGGVSSDQGDAFAQLGLAMLAAIVIVFAVMVATFRSLVQPLVLLVSVPFAATGAVGLLLATGTPLGVPALIGMLMLVGIVVTNAIVLIDLINQYREAGMPLLEAVVEGGRRRLRPILMTAVATICALIPMSLGLTGGGVFISKPLAIVVIGGLVSSTLLTLILVPTLYTMVGRIGERRQARRARRRGTSEAATARPESLAGKENPPTPAGDPATGEPPSVDPAAGEPAAQQPTSSAAQPTNGKHAEPAPTPTIASVSTSPGMPDGDSTRVTIELVVRSPGTPRA